MKWQKGKPKTGGRQKGIPNKTTREFKEIHGRILEHLSGAIGIEKILDDCRGKPEIFLNYLARTAPRQLEVSLPSGDPVEVVLAGLDVTERARVRAEIEATKKKGDKQCP